ncbi:PIG-L family deacetylase [Ruminococcaceae bacterium OttesenSCG-928-I18]|nr:PIG-L family deacetylase [Ruminococcaceae bacterium OttesenSCG-928-I18]
MRILYVRLPAAITAVFFLLTCLFLYPGGEVLWAASSAPSEEEAPSPLEDGQYAVDVNGQAAAALTDQNRTTGLRVEEGDVVSVRAASPFSQIYLVWDSPPGEYEIEPGTGDVLAGGQHGFLHDYTALPGETDRMEIRILQKQATLCDIYLFPEGPLPSWVQQWEPMAEKADLLVLPTHADDEHLFFGGTLPTYAGERNLSVQVAYLTNHWEEPYRPHELLNGLWVVGVRQYPLISDFPDLYADSLDTALTLYDRQEVLAFQVETIRRFKPDVIVGHDIDGEYGHGVHILNATTLLEALELAPDRSAFPESAETYGSWDVPKTYLHLWGENTLTMDWNQPLQAFAGATAFEMAQQGFAMHTSQQAYFSVEDFGPYDCRLFGLARSTVGPDLTGDDFFENIEAAEAAPEVSSPAPPPGLEASSVSRPPALQANAPPAGGETRLGVLLAALFIAACFLAALLFFYRHRRRRRDKRPRPK